MSSFPSPIDFGLPACFETWRPGQVEALLKATDAPQRFVGLVLPTGFGKSLVYVAAAHLSVGTSVILTSTIALQRQLERDFGTLEGTFRVQGQRAYPCLAMLPGGELQIFAEGLGHHSLTVDHGPCHHGVQCSMKTVGCEYYDAIRSAQRSRIVIANYAWWFASLRNPMMRLRPNMLILDEAHDAPDALADALGGSIARADVESILRLNLPEAEQWTKREWVEWAQRDSTRLARMVEGAKPANREAMQRVRRAQYLLSAIERLALIDPDLLLMSDEPEGVRFDLVWAAPYAESLLFRGTPRIVMTSATLTTKTADLLGLAPIDYTLHEAGDGFPVERRPVYILDDVPRMRHGMDEAEEEQWLRTIDHIIRRRTDRKGIVHCVSYKRRDLLLARSEFRALMITHGRHNTAEQIRAFKSARGRSGLILVSPAVTTGYDFPYDQCEYQILAKIPFPDSRDPVTKARTMIDKQYPLHVAMQQVVQMVGRGMRARDDRCETFVVDGQARWFLGKKNLQLAPRWFRRAIAFESVIPEAPPPLRAGSPVDEAAADDEKETA